MDKEIPLWPLPISENYSVSNIIPLWKGQLVRITIQDLNTGEVYDNPKATIGCSFSDFIKAILQTQADTIPKQPQIEVRAQDENLLHRYKRT